MHLNSTAVNNRVWPNIIIISTDKAIPTIIGLVLSTQRMVHVIN